MTLAVCCTLAGWFALWRVMSSPQTAGAPEAVLLIGGWGLGLLPLQVVPYDQRVTWVRLRAEWRSHQMARGRYGAPHRIDRSGRRWQRGHQ